LKITLPVAIGYNAFSDFADVQAELLFDMAPHLADVATFALHKDPPLKWQWTVSNVETGLFVTRETSKRLALRKAKLKLASQTPESMSAALEKNVTKLGLAGKV
jgi:hypothetical protein